MAIVRGNNLMCFVDGKSIALATSHSLEISGETISCSNKDFGGGEWDSSEMNQLSWTCSSENLIGDTRNGHGFDDLFSLMVSKKPVKLVFGFKQGANTAGEAYEVTEGGWKNDSTKNYYSGDAYITSLSLNAPNSDNSTMSVSFTGTGALKKLPASSTTATMSVTNDAPGAVFAAPATSAKK